MIVMVEEDETITMMTIVEEAVEVEATMIADQEVEADRPITKKENEVSVQEEVLEVELTREVLLDVTEETTAEVPAEADLEDDDMMLLRHYNYHHLPLRYFSPMPPFYHLFLCYTKANE